MLVELIGIGMDGQRTLTAEAAEAILAADVLIGAERMLGTVPPDGRERFCAYDSAKIADYLQSCKATRAAVLLSGDVGFFSGAKQLTKALSGHEVRCIPGISSLVYICAKMAIPWENMHIVDLHGVSNSAAVHVRMHHRTFFLLGGKTTAAGVCQRLCEYGLGGVRVICGERLGYPDERILSGIAAELTSSVTGHLCVMIAENPDFLRYLPVCIEDAAFTRGDVPMTKAVVRGITVSSLHIAKNAVCWDVGCGTGSVSVEMALRCPDGQVFAVDKNAAAAALTAENARTFSCDNITVRTGAAPEILHGLPAPDCVFIGGSSGSMQSIFDVISQKNPFAAVAVNAVTLETLYEAQTAFRQCGGSYEITQIAVSPMRKIGDVTMFQAQNPVFLIRGTLQ